MRFIKHFFRKTFGTLERRVRRAARALSPEVWLLTFEIFIACVALLYLLTGARGAWLGRFAAHADVFVVAAAAALIFALHRFVNRTFVARVAPRFAVKTYDERRILFDLGQAARGATNVTELYKLVVAEITRALVARDAAIFVRDEASGDYVCRVSANDAAQVAPARNEFDEVLSERDVDGVDSSAPTNRVSASDLPANNIVSEHNNVLAKDAFVVKRLRGLSVPLGVTERDMETWLRALDSFGADIKAGRERERRTLVAVGARLLIGITIQDRLVGILSLGERMGARQFSHEDKRMLMAVANQLAFVIENAKLVERMVAEEGLKRELALARDVQRKLLPERAPQSDKLELAAFCQPARAVGGDYYDFIKLGESKTGIAVADVAGKGISAALLMSSVQASLRSQAMMLAAREDGDVSKNDDASSPASFVRTMNSLVYASTGAASYVTFFYAEFDETSRTLTYVNAGHNPPFLIRRANQTKRSAHVVSDKDFPAPNIATARRANEESVDVTVLTETSLSVDESQICFRANGLEARELSAGGPVLGVFDECRYEYETLQLETGDVLIAYTDGLTESLDTGEVEFGEERLLELLTACASETVDEVRDKIVRRVREWSAGAPQHDDLTFVVMKVK